jgi:hypothetical protein
MIYFASSEISIEDRMCVPFFFFVSALDCNKENGGGREDIKF